MNQFISAVPLVFLKTEVNPDMTDSWLLHKTRVPCSACADWPKALQKHKQRATRINPALSPTQVTPGHDAERQLTRKKLLHTHTAPA